MSEVTAQPQADLTAVEPKQYSLLWPIVLLGCLILTIFFPYLFGGKTFLPSDMVDTMMGPFNASYGPPQAGNHYLADGLLQMVPYKTLTKEALEHGDLVYWNPHILAGYPEYAESLANNLDIFNAILFFTTPIEAIHLQTALELLLAGITMLILLRFLGVGPIVNGIFASAYMLNTLFISSAMHRCIIAGFCWVPLVIFFILRYYRFNRKNDILFSSLFLALAFLGGNFQTAFFIVLIVGGIVLLYPSTRRFYHRIVILCSIPLLAFGLSAVMWLPSLELLYQTMFQGGSLNSTSVYSAYSLIQRLLSLPLLTYFFLPGAFGGPQIFSIKTIAGVDVTNFNGAIGFLPATFSFLGCLYLWKHPKVRPFIIIGCCGIFLPILTPLYAVLYHRFFIVATFAFCVVGAVSFQSFLDSKPYRLTSYKIIRWVGRIGAVMLVAIIAACTYIEINYEAVRSKFTQLISAKLKDSAFGSGNESWMLGRVEKTLHHYMFASADFWMPLLLACITVLCILFFIKEKYSPRILLPVLTISAILPLYLFTRLWLPQIDQASFPLFPKSQTSDFLQRDSSEARFFVWRDLSKDPYILPSNSSNVLGINDIQGYESCTNRSMSVFYKRHVPSDSLDLRLLGLASAKYIVTSTRTLETTDVRLVQDAEHIKIYENLLYKPRISFARSVNILQSDSEVSRELLRDDFDGSTALFVKTDAPTGNFSLVDGGVVTIQSSENDRVLVSASTPARSVLILTDTYYPGWKCFINGKETPIHRVNHCMRAVVIESGTSKIVFTFEPDIFKTGSIASIASLLLCGALFFVFKKNQ